MKRSLIAIFMMARPDQLLLIILVYILGILIALGKAIWGVAALIPVSASIHYANEYADYETDALTTRTPFSGGSGGLHKYKQPRRLALSAAWTALISGGVITIGAYVQNKFGFITVLILASGAFFGWMYSLQPLALAWRGWGELDNAALGAVLLPVFGYAVIANEVHLSAVLAVLPFGMIAFVNLLATTWADREADVAVGKFTLATQWPIRNLRMLYWLVATGSFILIIIRTFALGRN